MTHQERDRKGDQVRLKIRFAAIASALALLVGLALTFAGAASAAPDTTYTGGLCLLPFGVGAEVYCAYVPPSGITVHLSETNNSDWAWVADPISPTSNGAEGEIQLRVSGVNTGYCIAENSSLTSTHTVELEDCSYATNNMEWVGVEQPGPVYVFWNEKYSNCLNGSVSDGVVNAFTCVGKSPNQTFYMLT